MKKSKASFVLAVSVFTLSLVVTFAAVQAVELWCSVCKTSSTEFFCVLGDSCDVDAVHGTWDRTVKKRTCKLGAGKCDPTGGFRTAYCVSKLGSSASYHFVCCP